MKKAPILLFLAVVFTGCVWNAVAVTQEEDRARAFRMKREAALRKAIQTGTNTEIKALYNEAVQQWRKSPRDPVACFAVLSSSTAHLMFDFRIELFPELENMLTSIRNSKSDTIQMFALSQTGGNPELFPRSTFERLSMKYPNDAYLFACAASGLGGRSVKAREEGLKYATRALELDPTFGPRYEHRIKLALTLLDMTGDRKYEKLVEQDLRDIRKAKNYMPKFEDRLLGFRNLLADAKKKHKLR